MKTIAGVRFRCSGLLALWLVGCFLAAQASAGPWQLAPNCRFELATIEQGREVLTRRDLYIQRMGPVERALRMQSREPVSEEQFLRHAAAQVLAFNEQEEAKLGEAVAALAAKLAPWSLPWPEQVLLVKTTGQEEAGAAYCRGAAIVLPEARMRGPAARLETLLAHELFHVLSNQNPELRRKLYAAVGFEPCNEVELPGELHERRITNPDAPTTDARLRLRWNEETVDVVPVLYAKHNGYDPKLGPRLFDYLAFRLMVVEAIDGRFQPELRDGRPVLLEVDDVPAYYDHIGRNTQYIIHPEEVLADNFVLLINEKKNVASPEILARMRAALTGKQ